MITMITTFFGVGKLRPAPGTWGSAAAVLLAVLLSEAGAGWLLPLGVVLASALGFWAVPQAIAGRADKDPSEIVIDEVAGQWLAFVAPFLLFRLFDIWKPWLVGRADRRGDAAGVMLDDLWAGLFAGVVSVILAGIYHGLLGPML
jgi:phosphatidylglycerophosphatase A